MTIYKKGTCSSSVTASSAIYSCTKCDYTELANNDNVKNDNKKCPNCGEKMTFVSSQQSK